jgi:hypothetical protein
MLQEATKVVRAPVLPATMNAAAIDRFGPPEVLTLQVH